MATLQEITEALREATGQNPGLGKTLKFDFKGEGFIHIDGACVSNEDQPADCTIIVSQADFEDLARGRLDPAAAFLRGKLKVRGDMAVAMMLQPLLAQAKR